MTFLTALSFLFLVVAAYADSGEIASLAKPIRCRRTNEVYKLCGNTCQLTLTFVSPMRCRAPNQVYTTCGGACELTCDNQERHRNQACSAHCRPGCFCKRGYLRDVNGNCVHPRDCKHCKDRNARIVRSPNPCPRTGHCRTVFASIRCAKAGPQWGCECWPGFYSLFIGGKCHWDENCPTYP